MSRRSVRERRESGQVATATPSPPSSPLGRSDPLTTGRRLGPCAHAAVVRAAPAAAKPFSATRITSARPCATELLSLLAEAGACFGVVLPLEDDGSVSSLARRLLGLTSTYARIMLGKFQRNQAFEPVIVGHLLDPIMRACAPARTGA